MTISELDETNPAVPALLLQVGLDLNPLPVRCPGCNECGSADAAVCGCCGGVIMVQGLESLE